MKYLLCKYGEKTIAFLIILTLLVNWEILAIVGSDGSTIVDNVLLIVWIILLFTSAVGLYKKQSWGFVFFYPAIILTTIGFSICIIPFGLSIVPMELRPWVMMTINSIVLLVTIWMQLAKSKSPISERPKGACN